MRKVSRTQTDSGTWSGDGTISTDLERVGLITRIDATAEITPSATLSGANQPDGPWRIIKNMEIKGGTHPYVSLPEDDGCMGGVLQHAVNQHDGLGLGRSTMSVTAPVGRAATPFNYCFHMGTRPRTPWGKDNPFDISAFIPAVAESQLKASWSTAGNDVMDDAVTIASAVMRYNLHMIMGTDAEMRQEMSRQGLSTPMIPAPVAEVYAHTATSSNYSTTRNFPVGAFVRRVLILEQDATGTRPVRAQDQVTGIAVNLAYLNQRIVEVNVEGPLMGHGPIGDIQTADDAVTDGLIQNYGGIYLVELGAYTKASLDYGLDLRGYPDGAFTLGLTISVYASGDDSLILWDRYQPYTGALGPGV